MSPTSTLGPKFLIYLISEADTVTFDLGASLTLLYPFQRGNPDMFLQKSKPVYKAIFLTYEDYETNSDFFCTGVI